MNISDLDEINSMEDFRVFLSLMLDDLNNNADAWENPRLEDFLSAMLAWIGSIESYVKNTGDEDVTQPSWKTFAKLLCVAKIYE